MHLDQSRARAKIFDGIYYEISFFLLLTKSVAMEPFLSCVQSASSLSPSHNRHQSYLPLRRHHHHYHHRRRRHHLVLF